MCKVVQLSGTRRHQLPSNKPFVLLAVQLRSRSRYAVAMGAALWRIGVRHEALRRMQLPHLQCFAQAATAAADARRPDQLPECCLVLMRVAAFHMSIVWRR